MAAGEEGHCQVRGTEPSCFTSSEVPFLFVTSLEMGTVPGQGSYNGMKSGILRGRDQFFLVSGFRRALRLPVVPLGFPRQGHCGSRWGPSLLCGWACWVLP